MSVYVIICNLFNRNKISAMTSFQENVKEKWTKYVWYVQ